MQNVKVAECHHPCLPGACVCARGHMHVYLTERDNIGKKVPKGEHEDTCFFKTSEVTFCYNYRRIHVGCQNIRNRKYAKRK